MNLVVKHKKAWEGELQTNTIYKKRIKVWGVKLGLVNYHSDKVNLCAVRIEVVQHYILLSACRIHILFVLSK